MKPVSLSLAWEESLGFIKREAGLLLPLVLLFIAMPLALIFHVIPQEFRQMTPAASTAKLVISPGVLLVIVACGILVLGGALSCYALGVKRGISLKEALVLGFRRLPIAIASAVLVGMALGIPLLLLNMVSPTVARFYMAGASLYVSARFLFLNAVIVDDLKGPVASIRRSWRMARGNTGKLLLLILGLTIPIMLVQMVAEILLGLLGFALGGADMSRQMSDLAAAIVFSLGQLFVIVLTTRLYHQLAMD